MEHVLPTCKDTKLGDTEFTPSILVYSGGSVDDRPAEEVQLTYQVDHARGKACDCQQLIPTCPFSHTLTMSTSPAVGQSSSLVSQNAGHVAQPSGIWRTSILAESKISGAQANSVKEVKLT